MAHPRVCGEAAVRSQPSARWMGSSPRVRGTLVRPLGYRSYRGSSRRPGVNRWLRWWLCSYWRAAFGVRSSVASIHLIVGAFIRRRPLRLALPGVRRRAYRSAAGGLPPVPFHGSSRSANSPSLRRLRALRLLPGRHALAGPCSVSARPACVFPLRACGARRLSRRRGRRIESRSLFPRASHLTASSCGDHLRRPFIPATAGADSVQRHSDGSSPRARGSQRPVPMDMYGSSPRLRGRHRASVDGSNPAISGHRKAGHFRRPETAREFYFMGSRTRKDLSLVKPGPPGP